MDSSEKQKSIVAQALATPSEQREAFLDSACGGDQELREAVESALSDHDKPTSGGQASTKKAGPTRSKKAPIPTRLKQALKQSYVIQERIGSGGMGELYLATHKTLGGKWAIKVLASDLSQDAHVVERFVNEAKIEANLQHPNIVKVFNIGHASGFHYFVMNYVEGEDLASRISRCAPLSETESVSIAFQICKALECAHEYSIIHRDLKPSNVRIDRYGTVIVLDFGIARALDVSTSGLTLQGQRIGTPLYMSPEQVEGRTPDVRSDLYALGVLFYEMLTGIRPFEADTAHAVFAKHLHYSPPPPFEARPEVSPTVSEIVMRLIEKDPDNRFQTARELGAELRPLRERTEVTPSAIGDYAAAVPGLRGRATPAEQSTLSDVRSAFPLTPFTDQILRQVVIRLSETGISRPLSADETRVLELVNDSRTVAELMRLTGYEQGRFLKTLRSLRDERAIRTQARPPGLFPKAGTQTLIERVLARTHLDNPWMLAVLAAVLISAGMGLTYFAVWRSPSPVPRVPVQLDAAPYATITITNAKGEIVQRAITPFLFTLPRGRYLVEFKYQEKTLTEEIDVQQQASISLRKDFWKAEDLDKLLDSYLEKK